MAKERKIYKPGQILTINGKQFRVTKPSKPAIGLCHLCDLAKEKQRPAGHLCHIYCYRTQFPAIYVRYYLKRIENGNC